MSPTTYLTGGNHGHHIPTSRKSRHLSKPRKGPTMIIYRHPKNAAIIATDGTNAIYVPKSSTSLVADQLAEAHNLLTYGSPRCFEYDPILTDKVPDPPSKKPLPDPAADKEFSQEP